MLLDTINTSSIPLIIYFVMGVIVTRIHLDGTNPRKYTFLQWTQFVVDMLRIAFLWPLVLFIEKSRNWLETSTIIEDAHSELKEIVK